MAKPRDPELVVASYEEVVEAIESLTGEDKRKLQRAASFWIHILGWRAGGLGKIFTMRLFGKLLKASASHGLPC